MTDAERLLRKLLDKIAVEKNINKYDVKIKQVPGDGSNITSLLFLATIYVPNEHIIEIFAKVSNLGTKIRSKTTMAHIFEVEQYFYSELLNIYERIQDKHGLLEEQRLSVPEFYGCNDKEYEETIVLENLAVKGYIAFDRFKTIDWEFASKSVTELAKLHSLSVAYGEEHPEEYKKKIETMRFSYTSEDSKESDNIWDQMMTSALNVTKGENKERLKNYVKENISFDKIKKYYRPIRCPVLCHGDYKSSNVMCKRDDDGNMQVIIIDYQTLQAGCPIMDLLYFIFNCSDEEFRGKYFDKLVEHYYTQLCLALRRLHVDPEKVYPREDFDYELKEMLPFGLCIGVFTLQIVTVEAANAPKLDGELSEFSVKTSDLFSERLNGIVNDYIRWGIL